MNPLLNAPLMDILFHWSGGDSLKEGLTPPLNALSKSLFSKGRIEGTPAPIRRTLAVDILFL